MQISLKNFKQHKDLTVDLPDSGIVMIQGKTGAGKSSILDAISFALYGQPSKVKSWSGGGCQVDLSLKGFDIKRTASPSSLTVKHQDITYLDAEAQQIINQKLLSMNENEFAISCYIQQGAENSLLSLPASEMQKTIQSVAYKGIDPDSVKKSLAKQLLESDNQVIALQAKYEALSEHYERYKKDLKEEVRQEKVEEPPVCPSVYKKKAAEKKEKAQALQELVSALTEKMSSGAEQELKNNTKTINYLNKTLPVLASELKKTQEDLSLIEPWQKVSRKATAEYSSKFQKKIDFFNLENKITSILNQMLQIAGMKDKRFLPFEQFVTENEKTIGDLRSKAVEVQNQIKELENWEHTVKCPACSVDLKIVQNSLIESKARPDDLEEQIADLKEKFDLIIQEGKKLQSRLDSVKQLNAEYIKLKASYDEMEDPLPSVKDFFLLQEKIEKSNKYVLEQEKLEKQYEEQKETLQNITAKFDLFTKQRNDLIESNISLKKQIEEDGLLEKKEKALEELESLADEIKALEDEFLQAKIQENVYEKYIEGQKRLLAKQQRLDELGTEVAEMEKTLREAKDRAAACEVAKKIHQRACSEALGSKIEEINALSQHYVDQLFAEDGTVIKLSNFTETQKKEKRDKIGVNIFHKGNKVKSIKEMSGGERARACLAFQLGLSDLYHSPFLMIDEGFNGLDLQTKEECLEALREVSSNKLLIVVEHGAPEAFFDEVVKIS